MAHRFSRYQPSVGVTGIRCWRRYIASQPGPSVPSTSFEPTSIVTASGRQAITSSSRWRRFQASSPLIPALTTA
jgi:hypothetical protein